MPSPRVTLLTRKGCHLCDDAHEVLVRYRLAVETVDIDASDELKSRYNECVPVVLFDGKERFRGKVDEVLLRRLLAAYK